jgi:transitional endoplasmic reticulum ATPase
MAGKEDTIELRVSKAIPSDVGFGRARISSEMGLDLKPGDFVEISGEERSTAAIYWRSRPEDAKMDIIRMDGIIRKNAGVSLGDRVTVRKVDAKTCTKLTISPVMANKQKVKFGPGIEGFAKRGLAKRPVVAGDRIFIPGMTLFAEALPFAVVQTVPKGIVVVTTDTEIVIKDEAVAEEDMGQAEGITYEDVGGIGQQLLKVREMIELPLKHPELFRRLGIDPPQGCAASRSARHGENHDCKGRGHGNKCAFQEHQRAGNHFQVLRRVGKATPRDFRRSRRQRTCDCVHRRD